jgi:hypothetical protein
VVLNGRHFCCTVWRQSCVKSRGQGRHCWHLVAETRAATEHPTTNKTTPTPTKSYLSKVSVVPGYRASMLSSSTFLQAKTYHVCTHSHPYQTCLIAHCSGVTQRPSREEIKPRRRFQDKERMPAVRGKVCQVWWLLPILKKLGYAVPPQQKVHETTSQPTKPGCGGEHLSFQLQGKHKQDTLSKN